jgi:hypothetical protein
MFKRKPQPVQGFCWEVASKALGELTGVITPMVLAGVVWLVITLPATLARLEESNTRLLEGKKEILKTLEQHDRTLENHELRIIRQETLNAR